MFTRFKRHIRDGFLGISRNKGMAFSSGLAVSITLILIGVFLIISANLQVITSGIKESISLIAFIDREIEDTSVLNSIETSIKQLEEVKEITYRSKEEEFEFYLNMYSDSDTIELLRQQQDDNPLSDVFEIKLIDGSDLLKVKNKLLSLEGIYDVQDGGDSTYALIEILNNTRNIGLIASGLLMFLSIMLIYNTVKITINSRKNELWIMRYVGAKNGYIRASFLVEGILIGFFGSIVPMALLFGGYYYLYDLSQGSFMSFIPLLNPIPYAIYGSLILTVVGILVGFIGSYISVTSSLRGKR